MANFERGSDDVRVFDGGEDEEDVEGSRLPLLIVIALFVLAAFGGVVWLAYQRGVAQGHSDVPRVIAAEPGPAKVAPGNAGGQPTPYTGLKIYQQPAPSDEVANADTAPPPPNAALKPAPSDEVANADTTPPPPNAALKPAPAPPPAAVKPTPAPVTVPAQTAPKPVAAAPPPVVAKPVTPPPPVAVKPPPVVPKPAPEQVAAVPPKPAETRPAAADTAAPAGAGLLQIGAYKSEAEANAAWSAYKAKHAALVGGLSSSVKQVDLGAKGTWYRLRIVAGSKDEASSLCTKLKAQGGDCLLAK